MYYDKDMHRNLAKHSEGIWNLYLRVKESFLEELTI